MGENNEEGREVNMMMEENGGGGEEVEVIQEMISDEFMPKMMLRVLLVESDDSTRQILTALLRKCNYKVAAIADGLQAWEILKKRHNNIDLILTELDLPSISGYALLTLIMEHDACKHIPVIMMSPQDSISMVLKCMLKGAADFLIKPIRKNELKNLWRHVWRRLTINDGHDPRNLATEDRKADAKFESNPATDQSGDNVSTSWKSSKCSKKATDSQMQDISWMKSSEETGLRNKEIEQNTKNVKREKELPVANSAEVRSESGSQCKNEAGAASVASREDEDGSCTGLATEDESIIAPAEYKRKANSDELRSSDDTCPGAAIDLIGSMKRQKCIAPQTSYNNGDFNHNLDSSTPELELSLRRVHDSEIKELDERRTLNHSDASAFSRYDSNRKSKTSSTLSMGELTEVKGVADLSSLPKTPSNKQEEKPTASLRSESKDQPFFSSLTTGPRQDISSKSQTSVFHREESPFLTSSSLNSGVVGPSSSSTRCSELEDEKKASACESASDLTELNANTKGPSMAGTSAIKEVVKHESGSGTNFELGQFRKTGLHSAQREAALAKFRLKRKGRCYEKKVRYQSRKKLAEQRVRVKGQFVRHVVADQMATDDIKT